MGCKRTCVIFTVLAVSVGVTACGLFGMDLHDGPQVEALAEIEAGEEYQ